METDFELKGDYIELIKLLKVTGLCESGGQAKAVVTDEMVKVDGNIELRKKCKIRKGQIVDFEENKITII